jgi:excisionase family DNA binding protein
MPEQVSPVLNPSDILTVEELAARLKVGPTWVYEKMRNRGDNPLPAMSIGRYLRIDWKAVSAWLRSTERQTHPTTKTRKLKRAA